jgi:hypothetical protein
MCLKGQCHKMDTFFEGLRVLIVFSKYALTVSRYLTALRHVIQRNFLFASIKLLSVLILTKLTEILLRVSFVVIGHCSPASIPYWLQ